MPELVVVVHGRLLKGYSRNSWKPVEARLRRVFGCGVEFYATERPGDARRLAAEALRKGASWIAAAGGDGTAHEVANAFFAAGSNRWPEVPFSVLPCGSANDLARTLGVSRDAVLAVDSLSRFQQTRIDVGHAEFLDFEGRRQESVFLNLAECGVGAQAVARLRHLPRGPAGYLAMALVSALTHRRRRYELAVDDGPAEQIPAALGILVSNGRFFGAGIPCAPPALPDDGLLDLVTLGAFGRLEVLRKVHLLLIGAHLRERKVSHRRVSAVSLDSASPTLFEMDGEAAGLLPIRIRVLPGSLLVRL
jgi:YegS/Rv2252/BmrU family lipid kinase